MKYTKPAATSQQLRGLMVQGSICCVDKKCDICR